MERIQAAISKARDTRKGVKDAASAAASGGPSPEAVAAASEVARVDDAWAALPAFSPNFTHLESSRVVAVAGGPSAAPFDVMRTKLLQAVRDHGWKRIAITSPAAGCGKTTTCLNLAFSLSRMREVRCIVIEADFRRPSMARVLGDTSGNQIAHSLAGRAPASANLLRYGTNLAIGTNRMVEANPAELLYGQEIKATLEEMEATFKPTLILFDLPPMLAVDDALAATGLIDGVLLVAAAEQSTVAEVDRCERELAARTNVLGVILNKCRYMTKDEGYDSNY
jgi:protein-tyrosine kinase